MFLVLKLAVYVVRGTDCMASIAVRKDIEVVDGRVSQAVSGTCIGVL